ncbi:MAG TPA: hypothetical protein VJS30_04865 [Paraburkholderia sp.]|nr:hypothetical protein [Paraburkholderia sp.]
MTFQIASSACESAIGLHVVDHADDARAGNLAKPAKQAEPGSFGKSHHHRIVRAEDGWQPLETGSAEVHLYGIPEHAVHLLPSMSGFRV